MDSNYLDMLRCLNKAGVDYIMVGGWAVNLHGYVRAKLILRTPRYWRGLENE